MKSIIHFIEIDDSIVYEKSLNGENLDIVDELKLENFANYIECLDKEASAKSYFVLMPNRYPLNIYFETIYQHIHDFLDFEDRLIGSIEDVNHSAKNLDNETKFERMLDWIDKKLVKTGLFSNKLHKDGLVELVLWTSSDNKSSYINLADDSDKVDVLKIRAFDDCPTLVANMRS